MMSLLREDCLFYTVKFMRKDLKICFWLIYINSENACFADILSCKEAREDVLESKELERLSNETKVIIE